MTAIEIEAIRRSFAEGLLAVLLRSSALVIVAAFLVFLLQSKPPELGHFVCRATLYSVLLLPVLQCSLPTLRPLSTVLRKTAAAISFAQRGVDSKPEIRSGQHAEIVHSTHTSPLPLISTVSAFYIVIASAFLLRLFLNLHRLHCVVKRSEPIFESELLAMVYEIWLTSPFPPTPRVCPSNDIRVPLAIGIDEVTILLPTSWRTWRRGKLQAVLAHESAYARRRDPQTTFLASVALCLYWLNPTIYWLRRRLDELAERSCDRAALKDIRPEEYAQILIEFVRESGSNRGHLVAASHVSAQRSLIKRRIELVMSNPECGKGKNRVLRALLICVLTPVLYVTATARLDQDPIAENTYQTAYVSVSNQEQANELESLLERHPDDLRVHGALMTFYANQARESAFETHLLWVIKTHPEARLASMKIYSPQSRRDSQSFRELTGKAWDKVVEKYENSPTVNFHAGIFYESSHPRRARDLFDRVKRLAPTDSEMPPGYLQELSFIYASAVVTNVNGEDQNRRINDIPMDLPLATALYRELETSSDPAFLSQVGTTLVHSHHDDEGIALIQKAVHVDPANRSWAEALDSAKAEPVRRRNRRLLAVN